MHASTVRRNRVAAGFTLLELMVSVAIVGLLAAAAIPSYMRYLRKAQTTEAEQNLEKIYNSARAYYLDRQAAKSSVSPIPPQFPGGSPPTPAVTCCASGTGRCMPSASDWETPTWISLQFSMDDPHYFRYAFESNGIGTGSSFTARAHADLDCDGIESTFEMYGIVNWNGHDMSGSGGVSREQRYE